MISSADMENERWKTMVEYINRFDSLRSLDEYMNWIHIVTTADMMAKSEITRCKQVVNGVPAADVVERKKGMWLYWWDEPDYDTYECSACGTSFNIPDGNPLEHNYKFCPNCGADMR